MLDDWFDERFKDAGARSFRFSPARLLMAFVVWGVLGIGADWRVAGIWAVAVLLLEWPLREITRPMARGLPLSRAEAMVAMAIYGMTTLAWSAAGAVLWVQPHVASQLAGAAFFAGHLHYLNTHHGRSMGALIPAMPALAAPAVAPLAVPHFHGTDQVLIEVTMLVVVGQAVISIAFNFQDARRMTRADTVGAAGETAAAGGRVASALPAILNDPANVASVVAASVRPLRVLVAEDNAVNQLVLKTLLAQVGVEPVLVGDGRSAVEAWRREPWDLILMDVQMPVMDGPAAAQEIRATEAQTGRARTPIVALSANSAGHQEADYAAGGMDGLVSKPVEAAALFAALQLAMPAAKVGRTGKAAA